MHLFLSKGRFLGAFAKLRRVTIWFVMSARLSVFPSIRPTAWNSLALTKRIVMKCDIWVVFFFENIPRKLKFNYNLTRITCNLREDQYKFLIISLSILLRMRNIWDKSCRGNQENTICVKYLFSKFVPFMS